MKVRGWKRMNPLSENTSMSLNFNLNFKLR